MTPVPGVSIPLCFSEGTGLLYFNGIPLKHSSSPIGDDVNRALEEHGTEHVAAVNTDNCAAETAGWDTIRDEYPDVLTVVGCAPHAGSLLFNKGVMSHGDASFIYKQDREMRPGL